MRTLIVFLAASALVSAQSHRAQSIDVKVLSTMLADDDSIGEWGFSALVVVDGHRILFDTGARPDTVLINARALKVDLSNVPDVILTHNHADHTGGLMTLKRSVGANALTTAHAGQGIFLNRGNDRIEKLRSDFQAAGGKFVIHDAPAELFPGVWLTGPVPRKYPERNWSGTGTIQMPDGSKQEDNIPEDMSLVIDTDRGLVVISGCGHAGVINTLEYARAKVRTAPVHAAIGGFHLFALDDEKLQWTAGRLREFGVQNFLGAHCTGIEATYRIRELAGLTRKTAAVAAVGAEFKLGEGFKPGNISR
ncbi:MAG TPA: MBL fold metallo-hydrolase [Bryobacteraceae bacterium]|nr:MBL fold metallo-hydrolase [Bryobacteraceae bacterium]